MAGVSGKALGTVVGFPYRPYTRSLPMRELSDPRVVAVQVGKPRQISDERRGEYMSGIFKHPVDGPVHLGPVNLDGDGQGDLKAHGGPDKALCVYPMPHYRYWETILRVGSLLPGAFGENLTVEGVDEVRVCVGDIFRIGSALTQISQPRSPCWKLARRWKVPTLTRQVQDSGRTGWYMRVLETGSLEAGAAMVLEERPFPELSVAACNDARYLRNADPHLVAALASCGALSEGWRDRFRRIDRGESTDEDERLG